MSDKLYQEEYKKFNDKQKDTMYALYMTGINYDGHSMVTYGEVEKSVAIVTKEAYQQGYNDAIEECLEVVDKIIDKCVKNGGCRSKCDEPYACVFGIDVMGDIEQLKEQKNE